MLAGLAGDKRTCRLASTGPPVSFMGRDRRLKKTDEPARV